MVESTRGQPGQWREEWALVVRWSEALHKIGRGSIDRGLCRLSQGKRSGFEAALFAVSWAMGWPEWLKFRRQWR
jgi:hypothetical protein